MLEKNLDLILLFDFYSAMLTKKQIDTFDMYYNQDFSLNEIAEELNISKQGVYDMLKRTETSLLDYESKLNLALKFKEQEENLNLIRNIAIKMKSQKVKSDECADNIIRILDKF